MVVRTARRAATVSVIEDSFVAGGPVPPVRQLLERAAAVSTRPTDFSRATPQARVGPGAGPGQKRVGGGRVAEVPAVPGVDVEPSQHLGPRPSPRPRQPPTFRSHART